MDIKIKELVKCSEKVKICDEEYLVAKNNLEMLKASYVLKNDWEKVLDKPKPTQKEKDAFMQVELEEKNSYVSKQGVLFMRSIDYYSENEPDEQCVKYEDEACWGCGECEAIKEAIR